jgi:hypothetical protein
VSQGEVWYLIYKDEEDVSHTVKGSVAGIRRSLREGLLGDAGNIRVGRSKDGDFQPLRDFPEFRDLVIAPQPMAKSPSGVPRPASLAPSRSRLPASTPIPGAGAPRGVRTPAGQYDSTTEHSPPHIPLGNISRPDPAPASGLGWWQMASLAGLVVASAVAGYFLFR